MRATHRWGAWLGRSLSKLPGRLCHGLSRDRLPHRLDLSVSVDLRPVSFVSVGHVSERAGELGILEGHPSGLCQVCDARVSEEWHSQHPRLGMEKPTDTLARPKTRKP